MPPVEEEVEEKQIHPESVKPQAVVLGQPFAMRPGAFVGSILVDSKAVGGDKETLVEAEDQIVISGDKLSVYDKVGLLVDSGKMKVYINRPLARSETDISFLFPDYGKETYKFEFFLESSRQDIGPVVIFQRFAVTEHEETEEEKEKKKQAEKKQQEAKDASTGARKPLFDIPSILVQAGGTVLENAVVKPLFGQAVSQIKENVNDKQLVDKTVKNWRKVPVAKSPNDQVVNWRHEVDESEKESSIGEEKEHEGQELKKGFVAAPLFSQGVVSEVQDGLAAAAAAVSKAETTLHDAAEHFVQSTGQSSAGSGAPNPTAAPGAVMDEASGFSVAPGAVAETGGVIPVDPQAVKNVAQGITPSGLGAALGSKNETINSNSQVAQGETGVRDAINTADRENKTEVRTDAPKQQAVKNQEGSAERANIPNAQEVNEALKSVERASEQQEQKDVKEFSRIGVQVNAAAAEGFEDIQKKNTAAVTASSVVSQKAAQGNVNIRTKVEVSGNGRSRSAVSQNQNTRVKGQIGIDQSTSQQVSTSTNSAGKISQQNAFSGQSSVSLGKTAEASATGSVSQPPASAASKASVVASAGLTAGDPKQPLEPLPQNTQQPSGVDVSFTAVNASAQESAPVAVEPSQNNAPQGNVQTIVRMEVIQAASGVLSAIAKRVTDPNEVKPIKVIIKEEISARSRLEHWSPQMASIVNAKVMEAQEGIASAQSLVTKTQTGAASALQVQQALKEKRLPPELKAKLSAYVTKKIQEEGSVLPPEAAKYAPLLKKFKDADLRSGPLHERIGKGLDLASQASQTIGSKGIAEKIGKAQGSLTQLTPSIERLSKSNNKVREGVEGKNPDQQFTDKIGRASSVMNLAGDVANLAGQKELGSLLHEGRDITTLDESEEATLSREKTAETIGRRVQGSLESGKLGEFVRKSGERVAKELEKHPGLTRKFLSKHTGQALGGAAAGAVASKVGEGTAKLGEGAAKIGSGASKSTALKVGGAAAGGAIAGALEGEDLKGITQNAASWAAIDFALIDVWVPLQGLMGLAYLDFHYAMSMTGSKWFRKPDLWQRIVIIAANFYHFGMILLFVLILLLTVCNNPVYSVATFFTGPADVCKYFDATNIGSYVGAKAASTVTGSFTCTGQTCTNQWDSQIQQASAAAGVDACITKTVVEKESHGNPNAIGHDSHNGSSDPFQASSPPLYGLNWSYSHGIGLTQWTIFPYKPGTWIDANTPSLNWKGKFYTVADFLNPSLSLQLTAERFAANLKGSTNTDDIHEAFRVYNAGNQKPPIGSQYADDSMRLYGICKGLNFQTP